MSASDRAFAMVEAFVTTTSPSLTVTTTADPTTAVFAVQVGGGTLSVGDPVYVFHVPQGNRSVLAALAVS